VWLVPTSSIDASVTRATVFMMTPPFILAASYGRAGQGEIGSNLRSDRSFCVV
jgi:hypothetical protein